MKTILKIIRISIFVIIAIYLVFSVFYFIKNGENPEKTYCGSVLKKSSDEVTIKYGTETKLYLLMRFDDIGTQAISVDPTTYMSSKIGDRLCFSIREDISIFFEVTAIIGLLVLIVIGFIIVVYLALFLITGKFEF